MYESISHDESDVVFGIDLRRWADSAFWNAASPGEKREEAPPVLTALLGALFEAYPKLPSDAGTSQRNRREYTVLTEVYRAP